MPRKNNTLYFIVSVVVFIVLEAAALAMIKYNSPLQNIWLSKGSHWVMAKLWGSTETMTRYFTLVRENERLREENDSLLHQLLKYNEAEEALSLTPEEDNLIGGFSYIPAKILKISNNRQHNYLILSKGSEDGIAPMSGVVTTLGVVGIVDAVSRHYSYAIAFTNLNMEVSARLGREGHTGKLTWDGIRKTGGILTGIPSYINVEEGDTVFTSGYSSIFPADIPLGITGSKTIVNGASYKINVKLFEDPDRLRRVTIVSNVNTTELQDLEEETL